MQLLELDKSQLEELNGGIAIAAVCVIASGVCYAGAGIAAWTGHDKVAAGFTIVGGCCDIAAGVTMLLP